ncbi:MAG: TraB/GumN family protein [Gammaproteobacteria bacterium]|nr:TraB/GumN family protein [Gammaproteobacteria bacterium]
MFRLGFNPMLGVEMHLTAQATRDGKPIEGFETVEEQLRFLDDLSPGAQNEMLLQTLKESAELASLMDEVIEAWRRGDTAFLEETLLADMQQYEELNRTLVVDRNHRWLDRIEELLTHDDDYLIVVGALHLVGEDGVPNLLEANGARIQQLQETLQD